MAKKSNGQALEKHAGNTRQNPPPLETRWKPGQSGNPNGRPPKLVSIISAAKEIAESPTPEEISVALEKMLPPKDWKPPYTKAQTLMLRLWAEAFSKSPKWLDAAKFLVEQIDGRATMKIAGADGGPLQFQNAVDLTKLSDAELRQWRMLLAKAARIEGE